MPKLAQIGHYVNDGLTIARPTIVSRRRLLAGAAGVAGAAAVGFGPDPARAATLWVVVAGASADPKVPWPEFLPSGEEFLAACVISDSGTIADRLVSFIRSAHADVQLYSSNQFPYEPAERTLLIACSGRFTRPAYVTAHTGPVPVNSATLAGATVVEDDFRKVTVRGVGGIMRLWRGTGQNLYASRLPSVTLNWYEGSWLCTVQSSFLLPEETLRVAESIRGIGELS